MHATTPDVHGAAQAPARIGSPLGLNRLSAAIRPDRKPVAWQDWRHLLYLHWPAPPEALEPLLPKGVELDLFRGRAWVGIVPFEARRCRIAALPSSTGLDVQHVSVRTYVHSEGIPGIYHLSVDISSHVAAALARVVLGWPCHHASVSNATAARFVEYMAVRQSGHRPGFRVHCEIGEPLGLCTPGTLDHFLLERYVWYTRRLGQLLRGRLHHAPLLARAAKVLDVDDELIAAAGMAGYGYPAPVAHYVTGADVELFGLQRVHV